MKKTLFTLILVLSVPISAHAGIFDWFGGSFFGNSTINRLDQWAATTTPSDSIVQRVYGKALQLSGLNLSGSTRCLQITTDGIVQAAASACGAGGGGSGGGTWSTTTSTHSGRLINYSNNDTDIVAIGSSASTTAEFFFDPNTAFAKIGGQFYVTGSSTLQNFTYRLATGTAATTTNLAVSSLTSELIKANATGGLIEAVSGTDYSNFGASVGPTELQSTDFGDWTCNGTTCTLDATYLTANQTITLSGDASGSGTTGITVTVADDSHAHTGSTLSGIDISDDTNLAVTSPIILTGDTVSIQNAAADGTTKGAASFTAADFDASSGNIAIDYTNGQAASGANKGFLTSADWTTFNNKQAAGNYITALTGDVTASGPGSVAATLATVNSNVGSFTNANVTVNAKGLVTAVSNGSAGGGTGNVATSSAETAGQLPYWTSTNGTPATLGGVATTSVTCTGDASCTPFTVIGSSPVTINATGGAGGSWATTSEQYFWSQFRDLSVQGNGYLAPTTTRGLIVNASSTIGDGTQVGGLTVYGGATTTKSINVLSTNAGGDNTFDSTSRLNLTSWQKAQSPNNFGELIRLNSASSTSKQMIAWYDATTTTPLLKAWIGWHYGPNDPFDTLNPHDHFSIETPDDDGLLQTRMEFTTANADTSQINTFNSNFTVIQGVSGVTGLDGSTASFAMYDAGTDRDKTLRWAFQKNGTAESGSSVGSDFQIASFDDAGNFTRTPFFIKRSTGDVGIATTTATTGRLNVDRTTDAVGLSVANFAASNNTAAILAKTTTAASRVFQSGIHSDTTQRFSIEASGLHEWGAGGASARDTNLYRNAVDFLRTSDSLIVDTNLGVATTSPWAKLSVGQHNGATTVPLFEVATSSTGIATTSIFTVWGSGSGSNNQGFASTSNLIISRNSTTTNATSTNLHVSGTLDIGSLSGVLIGTSGNVSAGVDGTDYTLVNAVSCTNQVVTALTAAGVGTCSSVSNAMLSNSTISGISLGSNLANLTATDSTLTFSGTYTGATARTIGLNLGNANTWTALQTYSTGLISQASSTMSALTVVNATNTNATSTNLTVSGTTRFSGLNCAANANGGTLTTDANGFVSCADDDSSAGSGAYPFAVAGNATSTLTQFNGGLTSYASTTIGNGTQAGGLTISGGATTTGSVKIGSGSATILFDGATGSATTTQATTTSLYVSGTASTTNLRINGYVQSAKIDTAFIFATTTLGTGTTTLKLAGFKQPTSFISFGCSSSGGGTFKAQLGDSNASSTMITSSTGLTTTYTALSSNNAFTSGETVWFSIGNVSGTVKDPTCSYQRVVTTSD